MRLRRHKGSSEHDEIDHRVALEKGPWACLILAPDDYTILSATDAYLRATMTRREDILGKTLFDVFPDDPADTSASGVRNLRASLERVRETLSSDVMAVQRYPVRRPADEGGQFEERFWSPINAPLIAPDGNLRCIIHRVEDVTEFVRHMEEHGARVDEHDALHARIQQIEAEIVVRAQELQRANERLRASESRFAAMFAGASLGIVILDDSGMPLETNPAFGRMTGYTADQLRQTQFASLMHAADRTIYQQQLAALRRGDSDTAVIETRFVKTGGAPAWVRLSLSAVAGTSPRQSTIVAIAEDITVAKTTEERLRRTEHLVAMAGRVARMGGWFVHLPEFEMVWSKEVCDIHEVPYGTALAVEDGIRFYASEWRDTISEAFTKCVELGVPYDLELEIITATDRRVWVRTIGEAVRDAAGTIVAVQGAFQDISRRKKSEEESRRLNERLTTVLESLSVGFFILDHEWRFTYINPEAEKMLLRTREDLVGRNIWDEFAPAIGTS